MLFDVVFSECRNYRYTLWRPPLDNARVHQDAPAVFVMLNPSTADEVQDDPTVRRCRGYSKDWGHNGTVVLNLYAYRSTDPNALKVVDDPVGPRNDDWLRIVAERYKRIVCAWGAHASTERVKQFASIAQSCGAELLCLGQNKDGSPKHPLYLRKDAPLQSWRVD